MNSVKTTWTVDAISFRIWEINCYAGDPVIKFVVGRRIFKEGKYDGIVVSAERNAAEEDPRTAHLLSIGSEIPLFGLYHVVSVPLALVYVPEAYLTDTYDSIVQAAAQYITTHLRSCGAIVK